MAGRPTDKEILDKFNSVNAEYKGKGDNWNIRITSEELKCPISYVRNVLAELEEKGEI